MQTLRDLHKASLVIDHQLKMPQGQEYSAKTPYGSAYKGNLACSVWQIERGESRDNTLDILAELCFEAVVRAANDYLDECNRAGRYLPPHEHLVMPIIRAGFYPQGLLSIKHFISREKKEARAERRDGSGEGRKLDLPDADSLIEAIMYPYP